MENNDNGILAGQLFPNVAHCGRMNASDFFSVSEALQSAEESALFMKKLVTIAVSNIFKFRGVFPQNCFLNYHCDNHETNVINEVNVSGEKNQKQVDYVIKRLRGLFAAIDLEYVKEWHVRLLSQGDGNNGDSIEMFVFHFTYGDTPLITLTHQGLPESPVELEQETTVLMDSVNKLLDYIKEICTTLPPLSEESNPHLTIWMKHTKNAPKGWIAPFYRKPMYGPIRYPPMKSLVLKSSCDSFDVITGFHKMKINHHFAQGEFRDLGLFQRYYGYSRLGRNRVTD